MDIQYYGANCLVLSARGTRFVFDDNLADLGAKSVLKAGDVALFTGPHQPTSDDLKLSINQPGEYEVADVSIYGIPAQAHIDEPGSKNATMYKLVVGDLSVAVVGHIYPELSEAQLEKLGIVDVLFTPVGGNGYTLDPVGALKVMKAIDPKLVIPTHYDQKGINYPVTQQPLAEALKVLGLEPKETTSKLKLKASDLAEITQLIVLEKS